MLLNIVYIGNIEYKAALEIQEKINNFVKDNSIDDTLLLLEHPTVLTLGRSANESNIYIPREQLNQMGVKVYNVSRGGDVTYHGPGQIVGYPIFNLARHGKDIKSFVYNIQEVFIRLLSNEFGIIAQRESMKYTGVYIDDSKITAIGIAVKHWVSMHGFAFNVNTDLSHFGWINPCGLSDRSVTSLQKITGQNHDIDNTCKNIAKYFSEVFEMEAIECTLKSLIG